MAFLLWPRKSQTCRVCLWPLGVSRYWPRFASGATNQTIYFPEVKAFHICYPPLPGQERIVGILDETFEGIATATAHAERNLHNARELFQRARASSASTTGAANPPIPRSCGPPSKRCSAKAEFRRRQPSGCIFIGAFFTPVVTD